MLEFVKSGFSRWIGRERFPSRRRPKIPRSAWLRRDVEHHRCRPLVEKLLDERHERVRILKACSRVEAGDREEFPVSLDAPVYPPRPNILPSPPSPDLYSCHPSPFRQDELVSSNALFSVDHDRDDDPGGTDP
jgi:hypothetical protein